MNIEPARPTVKGSPETFAGDVWIDHLVAPHTDDQRMSVAVVRFLPGARTAWHSHPRGQYLHVTQGIARFGSRDGTIIEVKPGETLYTPPGEDHWHASGHGTLMEHYAMFETGDETYAEWKEHVSDEQLGDR